MKNSSTITFLTIVFLVVNISLVAQNSTASNPDWKRIKTKKKGDGWNLYKRNVAGAKFQEVKIVGKINASAQIAQKNSMNMFVDSSVYVSKKGKSLGWFKVFKHTEDEIELYSFMKGNFLYKDRDVVVRYWTFEDSTSNTWGVKWHQIDKEGYAASDSIIRMPMDKGNWQFQMVDSTSCMAELSFQFHPGGTPPTWLINMIVKYYAPHEFEYLKGICENESEEVASN